MAEAGLNKVHHNGILSVVFISLLIDLLGFTVILPLFPSLLEFYKSNDKGTLYASMETVVTSFRRSIGIPENEDVNSVLFGGMIGSLFSLLQFFNSPFFGALSDVYGRRPLILLSLTGSSIAYVIWSLSDSFLMFLVARFVAGISEANVSISTAIIADLNSPKAKSRGMAIIGIAFSIGFVVGPLVGASFSKLVGSHIGFYIGPALFSLSLTLIDIVYVYVKLPETLPVKSRAKSVFGSFNEVSHLLNPLSLFKFSAVRSIQASTGKESKKSLRRLGVVYFLYLFLFSGLEFTLTFLVHRRFHFTRMDQGKMFAFLGFVMALLQGGYVRRKMGGREKDFALRGMCLLLPGFIIIGVSNNITTLIIGLLLFGFAAASVVPSISSLTAAHGLESEKGRVMGILRSLGALARATGPISASALYWLLGPTPTYVLGAVLLTLPILLLSKLPKVVTTTDKDK